MAVLTQDQEPEEGEGLTILEHLQELRKRLMIAAGGVVLGLIIGAVFSTKVMLWMKGPGENRVGGDFQLVFTDPLEYWSTFFRVMMLIAVTLAMPIIIWQIMAFVGPGLTRNEKKWAYPIVLGASLMFVAGAAFAFYVELPPALNFLLNGGDVAKPLISVQKYIDFVTKMMLINGLVFETPFVVMGFAKVGVVTSKKLLGWWRFAVVGAFIVAAIVTPSIDPITQTLVALPMIVLYFGGIFLAKLVEKTPIIPRY
jgi:sec-independent protein translocase protein TatC